MSGCCDGLGFGIPLIFVKLVVTGGAVMDSVLGDAVAAAGVSRVTACVVATIVIKGGRSLRTVVVLEGPVVVEAVVVEAVVVEAVVVEAVVVEVVSWMVVPAVVVTAFQMVTAGASVTLVT